VIQPLIVEDGKNVLLPDELVLLLGGKGTTVDQLVKAGNFVGHEVLMQISMGRKEEERGGENSTV
jgi:hypothetical protein